MTRRPAALATIALAVGVALTACAAPATPVASPTSWSPATPTPTPTPEVLVVAGGEKPPTVFGGDCAAALEPAVMLEATGFSDARISRRDPLWTGSVDNLGGLVCEWTADGVAGRVNIIPQESLGDSAIDDESSKGYFEQCWWSCAWIWESEELWIAGWESDLQEQGRQEADRRGAHFGPAIAARERSATPWTRDISQWFPERTCADVATAIGDSMGVHFEPGPFGYHDSPGPATELADAAARRTWCALAQGGVTVATVMFHSGLAWDSPWAGRGTPVATGVDGVVGYDTGAGTGYIGGSNVELSDGTNIALLEVIAGSNWSVEQFVAATSDYMASGLQ